jgi:hypothetical protein
MYNSTIGLFVGLDIDCLNPSREDGEQRLQNTDIPPSITISAPLI